MEKNFSPAESLQLIQSMIEKTRKGLSENSFLYILWGGLILAASVGEYILKVGLNYSGHYLVWNLMWIGAIVSVIYGIRFERKAKVKTYISETTKYVGIATGVNFTILGFIVACYEIWPYAFPIYFLLYGYLSFVIGAIVEYKPLRWAGGACWAISIAAVFVTFDVQLLLMALASVAAFLVPGYLLQARYKKQIQ